MVREVERKRSASGIRDSRGYVRELSTAPTVDRQLVKRDVPMATNPDEGLTQGASQLASRMFAFGAQLNQQFGQMADTLGQIGNTQQQLELAKIEEQNKELTLQARLDHAQDTPWKTNDGVYAFERHRLEVGDQIQEATREKTRRRRGGGGGGGEGGSSGSTGGYRVVTAAKAVAANAAREEADKIAGAPADKIAAASAAAQKVLVDNRIAAAQAKISAANQGVDPQYVDTDAIRKRETEAAKEAAAGLPAPLAAQVVDTTIRLRARSWDEAAVAEAKKTQDKFRKDFIDNTARQFIDGTIDNPEKVAAAIQTGAHLFRGANPEFSETAKRDGANAAIKAITEGAKAQIEVGDRLAFPRYAQVMGDVFDKDPKLAATVLADVQETQNKKLAADATESAKRVREAIDIAKKEKALNATLPDGKWRDTVNNWRVTWEYMKSGKDWNHPNFNAKDDVVSYWADRAKARVEQENLKKVLDNDPTADREGAIKAADKFQDEALRAGNYTDLIRTAESLGKVAKPVAETLAQGVTIDTTRSYFTETDDQGKGTKGPGVLFERSWDVLQNMSENIRQKALDGPAYAIYNAVQSVYALQPENGLAGAKQLVDAAVQKGGTEQLEKIAKGTYDLADMFGVDRTKPHVRENVQAELRKRISAVAKEVTGADNIVGMDEIASNVAKNLSYYHLATGGREGGDVVDKTIRQALSYHVPVVTSAGVFSSTVQSAPIHTNPMIAKEAAPFWKGFTTDMFSAGLSAVATKLPEIVQDSRSLPVTFGDAPEEDARRGYVWVHGSGAMGFYAGNPVVVAPGSAMENMVKGYKQVNGTFGRRDGRAKAQDRKVKFSFAQSVPEFRAQIAAQNAEMASSGFQWLLQKDDPEHPRYYLAYRPANNSRLDVGGAVAQTAAETKDATNQAKAAIQAFAKGVSELDLLEHNDAVYLEQIHQILKGVIEEEQKRPDSMVPRSLGTDIPIPKGLDARQAVDWLKEAYRTQLISSRNGRPYPSHRPEMGDAWNQLEFLKARNGFSQLAVTNEDRSRATIGAGVDLDSPWTTNWFLNKLGMDPKDYRDLREGIYAKSGAAGIPEKTAQAVTIDAYKAGERKLQQSEIGVLQELPWEAYSTLVAIAADSPKNVTKDMVKALNARDWPGVARAILDNKTATGNSARERTRAVDASMFLSGFGLKLSY